MSAGILPPPSHAGALQGALLPRRPDVLVGEDINVPGWVIDLETYRQWAQSESYPNNGWVSFLDGTIFVDNHLKELFTHNQVKGACAYAIMHLLKDWPKGMFVIDRMLLTNIGANLSTEPDGLFAF